eukprot:11207393-Lingulodinium_polyedra.AAC.1
MATVPFNTMPRQNGRALPTCSTRAINSLILPSSSNGRTQFQSGAESIAAQMVWPTKKNALSNKETWVVSSST